MRCKVEVLGFIHVKMAQCFVLQLIFIDLYEYDET